MRNKPLPSLIAILALACLGAAEKPDWKVWPRYFELKGNPPPANGFAAVVLDDHCWPAESNGLSGLRVSDNAGNEMPYFIRVDRKSEQSRDFPATLFQNKVLIGEQTLAVVDLGKARISNQITLDSPNEDFTRKVVLEGSSDQKQWKILLGEGLIFDVSNTRNPARKAYLSYSPWNGRYLRLNIFQSGQKDAFILNKVTVRVYLPETGSTETREFPGTPMKTEKGETTWLLDRGKAGLPLHEIDFDFESRDFYRPVRVEVSDDQKDWSTLSTCGFLYDAKTGGVENHWNIAGSEQSGRYARITVTDGNDRPLGVRKITVKRWRRTLLFRPVGSPPYRLYHGNAQAKAPEYDLASWASRTAYEETLWKAEEEMANPSYVPPFVPWTERPAFIWGMLILLMGVLGWFLWGALQKLKTVNPRR